MPRVVSVGWVCAEIDEVKKARQVAEITETEYFRELRDKAQRLRQRG